MRKQILGVLLTLCLLLALMPNATFADSAIVTDTTTNPMYTLSYNSGTTTGGNPSVLTAPTISGTANAPVLTFSRNSTNDSCSGGVITSRYTMDFTRSFAIEGNVTFAERDGVSFALHTTPNKSSFATDFNTCMLGPYLLYLWDKQDERFDVSGSNDMSHGLLWDFMQYSDDPGLSYTRFFAGAYSYRIVDVNTLAALADDTSNDFGSVGIKHPGVKNTSGDFKLAWLCTSSTLATGNLTLTMGNTIFTYTGLNAAEVFGSLGAAKAVYFSLSTFLPAFKTGDGTESISETKIAVSRAYYTDTTAESGTTLGVDTRYYVDADSNGTYETLISGGAKASPNQTVLCRNIITNQNKNATSSFSTALLIPSMKSYAGSTDTTGTPVTSIANQKFWLHPHSSTLEADQSALLVTHGNGPLNSTAANTDYVSVTLPAGGDGTNVFTDAYAVYEYTFTPGRGVTRLAQTIQIGAAPFSPAASESEVSFIAPTAAEYIAANAPVPGTDYVLDNAAKKLTIKTALGAAYFSVNGASYLDYTVLLAADVDVGPFTWTPVGTCEAPFSGTFEGQGHILRNLTVAATAIDADACAGLFGQSSGMIRNVGLPDCSIQAACSSTGMPANAFAGAVVGYNLGNGVVNCYATGAVSGKCSNGSVFTGGIAGCNQGRIANCYSAVQLIAASADNRNKVGGIVGENINGSVDSCWYSDIYPFQGTDSGLGTVLTDTNMKAASGISALLPQLNAWVTAQASADHFVWMADSTSAPLNSGYPVFSAPLSITPVLTAAPIGKTYDGSPIETPALTGNAGNAAVSWSYSGTAGGTYTAGLPVNAGSWYVKAHVTASGVYTASDSAPAAVTILKAPQAAPAAGVGYTLDYAAETIKVTAGYEVGTSSGFGTTVPSGSALILGGTYYVRLQEDSNHYPGAATAFAAAARPGAPAGLSVKNANGDANDGKIIGTTAAMEYSTGANFASATDCTVTETAGLAPGTYYVRYKATELAGASVAAVVTVGIDKTVVNAPADAGSKIYTGAVQKSNLGDTDDYSVTVNAGGTSVGQYDVVLTLKNPVTHKWADTETASETIKFTITQAANSIANLTMPDWTYGAAAGTPTAAAAFGTIEYTYAAQQNGSYAVGRPVNAGTYWVKASVTGTPDYTAAEAKTSFTISPAAVAVTVDTIAARVYTGAQIFVTPVVRANGAEIPIANCTLQQGTNVSAGANAGSVTVRAAEGGNYTFADVTKRFDIAPATLTVTVNAQSKRYGQADPDLTFGASGWQGTDGVSLLTGGLIRTAGENVGNYAIGAGTLSAGGNYTISCTPANLTISKADITLNVSVSPAGAKPGKPVTITVSAVNAGTSSLVAGCMQPNHVGLTDPHGLPMALSPVTGQPNVFTAAFSIPAGAAVGTTFTITADADDQNGNYNRSSNRTATVTATAMSAVNLTLTPDKITGVTYGDSVTYTAEVKKANTIADLLNTLDGTVQFYLGDPATGKLLATRIMGTDALTVTLDPGKLSKGTHTITAVYSGNAEFGTAAQNVATTVGAKTLRWDTSDLTSTKPFDGTLNAPITGVLKVSGAVGTEDPGFSYNAAATTAAYADANAGTGKTAAVTVAGAALTNDNYALPAGNPTFTGTITPVTELPLPAETEPHGYRFKLAMDGGINGVPAAIVDEDPSLSTPDAIKSRLKVDIDDALGAASGTSILNFDLTLWVSNDNGTTWQKATEDNFPAAGITVVIPWSELDLTYENAQHMKFAVSHMFATAAGGKTPGTIESPAWTVTPDGLRFNLTGLSPIAVGHKATPLVTFNANGGAVSTVSAYTGQNGKLSSLPVANRGGCSFDGWYTAPVGGSKVTTDSVFSVDTTVYAHWTVSAAADAGSAAAGHGTAATVAKTGDEFSSAFWAGLMTAGLMGLAGAAALRRRNQRKYR